MPARRLARLGATPDFHHGLLGRVALAACLAVGVVGHAHAQELRRDPPDSPEFMSRFNVHMSAAGLASEDPRFSWDTHWGGDFDFVDYVRGRLAFVADYEALLGKEFRLFDPNQGNYTLAVSGSVRVKRLELAGVLHHVSRHLSDRPKQVAVAYNAFQLRVMGQTSLGQNTLALRLEGGPVLARAHVDYDWMSVGEAMLRRPVSPHVAVYGMAHAEVYGVDRQVYNRSSQYGGRFEGGMRLTGKGGALELFGGYERVVDAHQFDLLPMSWGFAGFRLVK
ncbi:MAG: hypothetical protein A3H97_07470 [Acidobacteria bacterium RIFCSPLOWO2_02_FULL_65_29]|nr:MAG: hypothetical protein A3H97_07470 [Acidobacteria bacterium RIFCSPLOWO2_02_FULL_65_29]